ncbi:C40 family peptidase [Kitasatospora sp. NPDC001664]
MNSPSTNGPRGGRAARLAAAVVLGTVAAFCCGTAHARPLPDPTPSASAVRPTEEFVPALGPLGPDGQPAEVAAPGPAPSVETLRDWVATAQGIELAEGRLPALRAESERLARTATASEALADAGRIRQEMLGDLLSALARAQYTGGGLTRLATFLNSTPAQSLERWRDDQLGAAALAHRYREAEEVYQARAQEAGLARAAATTGAAEVDRAGALRDELTSRQGRLRSDLADRFGDGSWKPGPYDAAALPDERPDATAQQAVAYALSKIGSPYVWGAVGPGEFDCSGLTSQAWAAAGTTIPRTSQEQWAHLPRVPEHTPLRPGDLVIYFADATHVGLYVGDGLVVHAPRPGTVVRLTSLHRMPVAGVVRPASTPDGQPAGRPVAEPVLG